LRGNLLYITVNDVVLLGSPIWMPVAWAAVITELGYPAVRLYGFLTTVRPAAALWQSTLAICVAAGITVGLYEYFAYKSGWWRYAPARAMIGHYCALYIPVGEAIMFIPILPIAAHALSDEKQSIAAIIESGVTFALSIAVGYAIAYFILA
jgi:hypothetical protein